jgi:DNA polymerase-4
MFSIVMANPTPQRTILHADLDAFFASVEVLDCPELRGKPVIVGGAPERRGVVAAASYEARAFGVRSAMSTRQALRLCPEAVLLPPRFDRYVEASRHVFAIFESYSPLVEPLSLDEAFLDLTGCERLLGPPEGVGRAIKDRVHRETGLVASVGIAPNKLLAKLASDLRKPDGFVVVRPGEEADFLADLPVGRLWGVGKVTQEALQKLGIALVRDLRQAPEDLLRRNFGPAGAAHLTAMAWGRDDRPVQPEGQAKSIGAETTFAEDVADAAELGRQLDLLVDRVAQRLRRHGLRASTARLKARYPDFATVTRSVALAAPACATSELRRVAREMLERRLGRAGRPLRLIGFTAAGLSRDGEGQIDLFGDPALARAERVDQLMDRLKAKHGAEAIAHGCLATARPRMAKARIEKPS